MTEPLGERTSVILGCVLFLGVVLVCLSLGPDSTVRPWSGDLWSTWWGGTPNPAAIILLQVRLPRVLLAALVGGCLALAGLVFQDLLQNPLADPYIIGVSGGCGLSAVLVQVMGIHQPFVLAGASFAGGFGAVLLVERLASLTGSLNRGVLVLAGVMANAFFSAMISLLLIWSGQDMPRIFAWLMGSLNLPLPELMVPMSVLALGAGVILWVLSHPLDLLSLGDFQAYHLGLDPERIKWITLMCAAMLTAVAVSLAGMIGFLGMFTPHAARMLFGFRHRILVPLSFLAGGILLMATDTVVRIAPTGTELPVGALTALLGGPFFLFLLLRRAPALRM